MLLFIISWLLCGLLVSLILTAYDLRVNEYNPNYFDYDFWVSFLMIILLGYANIVVAIVVIVVIFKETVLDKIEPGRIIYKITNIGVKKSNIKIKVGDRYRFDGALRYEFTREGNIVRIKSGDVVIKIKDKLSDKLYLRSMYCINNKYVYISESIIDRYFVKVD
ncbi:hypothetical protein F140042L4_19960 [Coprococcus phoceensis]